MTTVMIFHEVDDVDHWLRSPKREEFFGPLGMTVRTFVDPDKTKAATSERKTSSTMRHYFIEISPRHAPVTGYWALFVS